jgi:hypothetical protein
MRLAAEVYPFSDKMSGNESRDEEEQAAPATERLSHQ